MASQNPASCTKADEAASAVNIAMEQRKTDGTVLIKELKVIADAYDLFLIDQWGVLHNGQKAMPGAVDCLQHLMSLGKHVVILSNSGKRASLNAVRLKELGIDEHCYSRLITSGEVARDCLSRGVAPLGREMGRRCLLWTHEDDDSLLEGMDIECVNRAVDADFILLAGVDDHRPLSFYEAELSLALALSRDIPLVCANPDTVRFSPHGLVFSAGEVAQRYESMGGKVHYIGKPHPYIYEYCRKLLPQFAADRTLAIGDSCFHDIMGGAKAGLHTAFVSGGIHREEFVNLHDSDHYLGVVAAMTQDYGVRPDWVIPELRWVSCEQDIARIIPLSQLRNSDVPVVGGKNASLGEMLSQLGAKGVRVPGGFATTVQAYREFMAHGHLDQRISALLDDLDVEDVAALARAGATIRGWILTTPFPSVLEKDISAHYQALIAETGGAASFAVRSSATAEDLPDASFAGQQETFLNIMGLDNILLAIREVFASLYNDRAIAYRVHKGFSHADVAISAGIQRMVRSDQGSAGVMFSMDTESGFRGVVFITASYGLGEMVVQGAVNPDEYYVHKELLALGYPAIVRRNLGSKHSKMVYGTSCTPGKSTVTMAVTPEDRERFSLTDAEVLELAAYAVLIEDHYGHPMDIEWGKDGLDGKLYILQARPETVKSQQVGNMETYTLGASGHVLVSGRAVTQRMGQGPVRLVRNASEMELVQLGDVLVADMTDPNWEPVMKRASALVTNRGGRTCHAAIIARELGIPAIVGTGNATEVLEEGSIVTVSCSEGDTGKVYAGALPFHRETVSVESMPDLPVKVMMNVGNPDMAFTFAGIPNDGVGLARVEFVINNMIGIHPKAILDIQSLPASLQAEVRKRASGYNTPRDFYIEKLAEGVATIAAAFYPKQVIVRLSDFKSNEYRKLIGGDIYEPDEENPMLGFRGAARYIAEEYRECFELEVMAMRKVRDELGLTNVALMIPFVRTLEEARSVVDILAGYGLRRGENGLRLIMMCEIPSNALLADEFLAYFDGFSIGSNDMTQLALGMDRDSGLLAGGFDERDPAVKALFRMAIASCNRLGKYVGICGQGPSDHPDLAQWLLDEGIQSLSLNPDTVIDTRKKLASLKA